MPMRKIMKTVMAVVMTGAVTSAITSCDDGPIYAGDVSFEEGRTLQLKVAFDNTEQWPDADKYEVLFAGYVDDADYPAINKSISRQQNGKELTVKLTNVPDNVTRASLTIVALNHKLVYNLYSERVGTGSMTIDAGTVTLNSIYGYMQQVFNEKCISCHGQGSRMAGGLNLTEGNSYENLVNMAAATDPTQTRVIPGEVDDSYIYKMLTNGETPANANGLNHVTTVEFEHDKQLLLVDWILKGARK